MDGFEVLLKLRESPNTLSTPVVMLTGLAVVEGEARSMALGSTHYITKPWNIDVLEATVRVAISTELGMRPLMALHYRCVGLDAVRHHHTTSQSTSLPALRTTYSPFQA